MAGTRSSARLASQPKSSPTQPKESPPAAAGSKRKSEAGSSPTAKRGRKASDKKEQKTIEETMDIDEPTESQNTAPKNGETDQTETRSHDQEAPKSEETTKQAQTEATHPDTSTQSKQSEGARAQDSNPKPATNGYKAEDKAAPQPSNDTSGMDDTGKIEPKGSPRPTAESKSESEKAPQPEQKEESQTKPDQETKTDAEPKSDSHGKSESGAKAVSSSQNENDNAVQTHARDDETPSSILEKGIIYFFFRGRVGVDDPSNVDDLARTYMILRPIPHGAKIGEGTIGDGDGKCRLLALPKKVLPLSGKDKFMTFVEKSKKTFKELRDEFMSASDYETQTAGTRHTPAVTPVAEGVYALTTTGRESHLAYMITIPQQLSEVQKDMGIREQGSFITSAKNPQYAGPANTNLPQGPGFPKEILDEFRNLRWAPLQPKFLDYENTQFLLIGESGGLDSATAQQSGDQESGQEAMKEELEKLEGEDEIRVKDLNGNDAVFADLGISKKEYPQVPSTWSD